MQPVLDVVISKLKNLGGGQVVVGGQFSNAGITTGFYFREIGLFAQDPDAGEILYSYGNAGSLAEWIDPDGTQNVITKSVDIRTSVGQAEKITASIEPGSPVTVEMLNDLEQQVFDTFDSRFPSTTHTISLVLDTEQGTGYFVGSTLIYPTTVAETDKYIITGIRLQTKLGTYLTLAQERLNTSEPNSCWFTPTLSDDNQNGVLIRIAAWGNGVGSAGDYEIVVGWQKIR